MTDISDIYAPGREILAGINRIVTPKGVQETFEVTLGDARQVVNVRGADRDNPILLFVHGGPGSVEMPLAWSFQRPWEDYFTVVQWDQRGAGRSYLLEDPAKLAPTMHLPRYRDDGIELIELLCKRYSQKKIFLMGLSWGSALGLSVAAARPDLLHAYIGVGQLINMNDNERVNYEWTLGRARAENNKEAIAELEALAPFPGDNPTFESVMGERKWSMHYGALTAYRGDLEAYFNIGRLSPEYTPADVKAMDEGSTFTITTLWPRLRDLDLNTITRLETPLFLHLGRHDYTTPWPIAEAWFEKVSAPQKKIIWFEHSAHLPMFEEPGRTLVALLEARPLAG